MYLKGSKLSYKKRRRSNPIVIGLLLLAIGAFIYLNIYVVPSINPPFVPTPTETRDPVSYEIEAEGYFSEGRFTIAKDTYKLAINANPQSVSNYINLAKLQIYTGDYEEARVNAENAILLKKDSPEPYALLGWAYGLQGEFLQGESYVKQAITINPNSALGHAVYAYILASRVERGAGEIGTVDLAIEESRTAIELDSNLLEAHWARGYVLEITSNYEEARVALERAIQINAYIADLHLALGRNFIALDRADDAVSAFITAISLNPSDPLPNYYISRVYGRLGEFAKAIQYAEEAIKDEPSNPNLHANLGTWYYRNGQYNQALTYLELAVRGGATSEGVAVEGIPLAYSTSIIEIYSRYGLALANVNRCNEAVQVAQAMIQNIPDDETGVYNAEEMIRICQELLDNPPTPMPTPEGTLTPSP